MNSDLSNDLPSAYPLRKTSHGKHVITGPFSYSGSFLAKLLISDGATEVVGLVNHKRYSSDPKLSVVKSLPLDFSNPKALTQAMTGADVFYNTYWVRFNHQHFNHQEAVKNTRILFKAAKEAQVGHIVHLSITNPSLNSPLEYFRTKALLEKELAESGLAYTILRPAVLFGGQDVLINNIAWTLRKFPIFGLFGKGQYNLRPIFVGDLAYLMKKAGEDRKIETINAVGPERFTYRTLVRKLSIILGLKRSLLFCPPPLAYAVGLLVGLAKSDIFITWPEIKGLMSNLLDTPEEESEAPGRTRLTDWAQEHKDTLGITYASELLRHS